MALVPHLGASKFRFILEIQQECGMGLGFPNPKSWSRKNLIVVTAILGKKGFMTFLYEKDFIGSIFASMNLTKLINRIFFHLKIPFTRNPLSTSAFNKQIFKNPLGGEEWQNHISPTSKSPVSKFSELNFFFTFGIKNVILTSLRWTCH